jgi:translation initiation factor 1 (eIF-1/SUI1)
MAPFNNPFEGLKEKLGPLPPGKPAAEKKPPARRAILRRERKGHGGKEMTLIRLDGERDLAGWLDHFKHALGCGGSLVGDEIALQGDQRERARALLIARGIEKIVMG